MKIGNFNENFNGKQENELLSILLNRPQLVKNTDVQIKWLSENIRPLYKAVVALARKTKGSEPLNIARVSIYLIHKHHRMMPKQIQRYKEYYQNHHQVASSPEFADKQLKSDLRSIVFMLHQHYLNKKFMADVKQYRSSDGTDEEAWNHAEQIKGKLDDLQKGIHDADGEQKALDDFKRSLFHDTAQGIHVTKQLDGIIGGNGFVPMSTTVLAAGTSVGKTTFSLATALNAVHNDPKLCVDYFSLEMSPEVMDKKAIAYLFGRKAGHRAVANEELSNPFQYLKMIDDRLGSSIRDAVRNQLLHYHDVLQRLKDEDRLHFRTGTDFGQVLYRMKADNIRHPREYFPIVDYLGLLNVNPRINDDPRLKLQHVTHVLKQKAIALDCPILELSQLNRNVSSWKQPTLSNLRDSGSVEEDADNVLFLYRTKKSAKDPVRCLHCSKARSGEVGNTVAFHFDADHGIFKPFSASDYQRLDAEREQDSQSQQPKQKTANQFAKFVRNEGDPKRRF